MIVREPASLWKRLGAKRLGSAQFPDAAANVDAPLLTAREITELIEQATALRRSRAHGSEVFLRHPGDARSAHLGRGLDFEEVRAYQPGDDIRAMDWRTTARTGEPYLKVYREEHHPALHIVIDRGAGMRFGTRRQLKAAQAARCAILAAALESSAHACVGGTLVDEELLPLPCHAQQAGILQLAQACAAPCPPRARDADSERTRWFDALRRIAATLPQGSRLLLLSDFQWLDAAGAPLLAHLAARHDVAAIQIFDAVERQLPTLGRMPFFDLTEQRLRWIETGDRELRARFAQASGDQQRALASRMRELDIDYFALGTEQSALDLFLGCLDARPAA